MTRFFSCAVLAMLVAGLSPAWSGKDADVREALQALQEYIGGWKGSGTSEKNRSEIWKESADWSWRFKGKDVFFSVNMKDSKLYKAGELRYLADKDRYQLTLEDKKGEKQDFVGELKKGVLTLERVDPKTKDTEQIKINTAGGGLRLVLTFSTKLEGRTLFNKQFQIAYTKEGETFGTAVKKPECVVTGGLGTMAVSYMGQTYYVCCSGCRDAFNENPAKVIKDYLARKKKGE